MALSQLCVYDGRSVQLFEANLKARLNRRTWQLHLGGVRSVHPQTARAGFDGHCVLEALGRDGKCLRLCVSAQSAALSTGV